MLHPFFIFKDMVKNTKTLTVLDGIKLSTDYLESKGIDSPRMNAELMSKAQHEKRMGAK